MADRPVLVGHQAFIGVQFGDEGRGDVSGCEREVGAEQDATALGASLEAWQRRRTR